ncbi:hypothetical protein K3495_g7807 [Podosphaera aphanis]|nr:hypothetical protein K3495_g7807 [Podosphaera aphanis]
MKIAHLQFSPIFEDVVGNIDKVDALLKDVKPGEFDLLLLPEMALTGYNFLSLEDIVPFLEMRGSGPSSEWARLRAQRDQCIVGIGYAETTVPKTALEEPPPEPSCDTNFNACTLFAPNGELVAHYRKHFLYVVDELWCIEGKEGFYAGDFPEPVSKHVAMGICMDINPYRSIAPWEKMEFANHALASGASLVIVTMAWNSLEIFPDDVLKMPSRALPDYSTLAFWISRFTPLVHADQKVILVMGNRTGIEGEVIFSGSSMIAKVGRGTVEIWDVAGKGEDRLLVVDTETKPKFLWDFKSHELVPNP